MSELTERLGQIKEQEERSRTRMIQDLILKLQMDKLKMQLSESKIRQQIQETERVAGETWGSMTPGAKGAALTKGGLPQVTQLELAGSTRETYPGISKRLTEVAKPYTAKEKMGLTPEQETGLGMYPSSPADIKRGIAGLFPWLEVPEEEGYVTVTGPEGEDVRLPAATWYQRPSEPEEKTWIDSSGRLVQKTDVEYGRAMEAGEVLTDNVPGYTKTITYYNDFLLKLRTDPKQMKKLAISWGYKDSKNLEAVLRDPTFLRQMAIKQAMEDYGQGVEGDYGKYDLGR